MKLLMWITWFGDLVALVTALAMLKDTFFDRAAAARMWEALAAAWVQIRTRALPLDMDTLRPALRFGIRAVLLVLIMASAGVCVVYPMVTTWHGMLLRLALALQMASQVPCPWIRWITVGDARSKGNDPPGVERRTQERHVH